ncbi:MAG: hypothetical protein DLM57_04450 [Pseudonocardiales bacterium]|nr:MAG: hypothetical protein DLM57_04450 [Pseudonocardiales bacterium]
MSGKAEEEGHTAVVWPTTTTRPARVRAPQAVNILPTRDTSRWGGPREPGLHRFGVGLARRVRRAEIWTVSGGSDYAGKPRPAGILLDNHFDTDSVTVCPYTPEPPEALPFRVVIEPTERSGLTGKSRAHGRQDHHGPADDGRLATGEVGDGGVRRFFASWRTSSTAAAGTSRPAGHRGLSRRRPSGVLAPRFGAPAEPLARSRQALFGGGGRPNFLRPHPLSTRSHVVDLHVGINRDPTVAARRGDDHLVSCANAALRI